MSLCIISPLLIFPKWLLLMFASEVCVKDAMVKHHCRHVQRFTFSRFAAYDQTKITPVMLWHCLDDFVCT